MLTMLMTALICAISSTMLLAMNPLSLGIIILMLALSLSITFSLMMSSWLAFLIFLIYISGMLVMFSYFVALIPNQQSNMVKILSAIFSSSFVIMWSMDMWEMKLPIMSSQSSQMSTMYMNLNVPLLMLMAWILLFAMIVVVKLVTNKKGPLRPFENYV